MLREKQKYFTPLQIILDVLSLGIAYGAASSVSCGIERLTCELVNSPPSSYQFLAHLPFFWDRFINVLPFLIVSTFILLSLTGSYRSVGILNSSVMVRQTGIPCVLTGLIFWALLPLYTVACNPYLLFMSIFIAFMWLLLIANRICLFYYVRSRFSQGYLTDHVLIVGTEDRAKAVAGLFHSKPDIGIRVVGVLTEREQELHHEFFGTKVIGHVNEVSSVLEKNVVDCVIFCGGIADIENISYVVRRCETEGVDFALVSSLLTDRQGGFLVEELDGLSLFRINALSHSPFKLFGKRLLDVVASTILIIACIPVWIILPIVIRMESEGPAFFRQERVGKHGRRFSMYKFRSMVVGADKMQEKLQHLNEMDGPVFKIENDPRFTRLGKFLRKTSLDEMPQLFNVLKGDMSLVGPRPPLYSEVLQYRPWERKRLSVVPGITCLWQVTGRNQIKFDEWMKLDIQYIDNWSLTLDLKILVRTLPAVFLRKGAQ
jgi:exopolysaccharide biosynthesis polyprenyl glycosylphosphotransferase